MSQADPIRIVLVGTSAPGLLDLRSTPIAKAYPGVEVHANIISGILDDMVWHAPAWSIGVEIITLLAVALITLLVTPRLSPLRQVALSVALVVLLLILNTLAFVIEAARDVLIWGRIPDMPAVFAHISFSMLVAWAGFFWFQKTRRGFGDVL